MLHFSKCFFPSTRAFFHISFIICCCCCLVSNVMNAQNMKIVFLCKNISFRISFDSIIWVLFAALLAFCHTIGCVILFLFRNFLLIKTDTIRIEWTANDKEEQQQCFVFIIIFFGFTERNQTFVCVYYDQSRDYHETDKWESRSVCALAPHCL